MITATEEHKAFDLAAPEYDREFESHDAVKRLRRILSSALLRYFSPGDSVLELNCGTGTDAVSLARHGVNVLATDASAVMLREVRIKIETHHLEHRITTRELPFDRLSGLQGMLFDGVISNLGGLNCTRNLDQTARNISRLVRPRGHIVISMMTDLALWETLAALAHGDLHKAFRRRNRHGAIATIHGTAVRVYYYSPGQVTRFFSKYCSRVEIRGLNIVTPPPASPHAYARLGKFVRTLEHLDDLISQAYPFYRLGDHFLIVLRRNAATLLPEHTPDVPSGNSNPKEG